MEVREFVKGYQRMCSSYKDCNECPLNISSHCYSTEDLTLTEEEITKVEKWIEEHPIITNAMRFEQVFGFEPKDTNEDYYCIPMGVRDCGCGNISCIDCQKWWDKEYTEPKGK